MPDLRNRPRPRLLFTGGGGAGTEAIDRILADRYDIFFADADPDRIAPSISPDRRIALPLARSPGFLPEFVAVTARHAIDFVVPGVDEELSILAANRAALDRATLVLPDNPFLGMMLDKGTCSATIAANRLESLETVSLSAPGEATYPAVAKPRDGRGSRNVVKVENADQAAAYEVLAAESADAYVLQRRVEGHEFTVVVDAGVTGRLRAVIPIRVHEKRGITIHAETDPDVAIVDYVRRFQQAFADKGARHLYNIQGMLTPGGAFLPFEVNPRVSTTFCLALGAGYDPFAEQAGPGADMGFFQPPAGVTLRRTWLNEISPGLGGPVTGASS